MNEYAITPNNNHCLLSIQERSCVGECQFRIISRFCISDQNGKVESRTLTDSKGFQWRILLFPNGNEPKNAGYLSVFLKLQKAGSMPPGYRTRQLHIDFAILHTTDIKRSLRSEGGPIFYGFPLNASNCDYGLPRGFSRGMILRSPTDFMSYGGFITVSMKAEDIGCGTTSQQAKLLQHVSSNEPVQGSENGELLKCESGSMVGLRNQGATCYMNSLLQTLFHIRQLRKAVYSMPTEDEDPVTGVSLALQRTFFRLESSTEAVSTKDLTKSFGWDAYDSFLQQDVQELNRVLCDRIEEKMKGTPVAGTIKTLFAGKTLSYIKCVDVDYSSSREEDFYDLQLDVKGCKNIMESFDKYTEEEVLDGEDKYDAGPELGKQKARKGTKFLFFPPVLTIHLKRFEYNTKTHTMVKVNDRFEFPFKLDISKYLVEQQGPTKEAQDSEYMLHSILVHSGDLHGGHYYAYIRPSDSVDNDNWVKFNDEHVTVVDHEEAIEGSCGGEGASMDTLDPINFWPMNRCLNPVGGGCTSAYMLVYMRKTALPLVMANFTVPETLCRRLRNEDEAREKLIKEEREAHLFCKMRVATDRDVLALRNYRVHQDFADFDECLEIRVKKANNVFEVLKEVSAALDVPLSRLRVWNVTDRENGTARPDDPLEGKALTMFVLDYLHNAQLRWGGSTGAIRLYAEIHDEGETGAADDDRSNKVISANEIDASLLLPTIPSNSCMLYFKFFDPFAVDESLQLRYVGRHLVLSKSVTVQEFLPIMARMVDLPSDIPLLVFEVITVANICQLAPNSTMLENELQHGDILCFQVDNTSNSSPTPPLCSLDGLDGEVGNNHALGDLQAAAAAEHSSVGENETLLINKAMAKRRRLRKAVVIEKREMRDGVSRMILPLHSVKDFFSMVTKRVVVHFVPRSTSGGLYVPWGRTTAGSALGVSIELLKSFTLREVCEALAQELEFVENPLSLFICPPESSYNFCPIQVPDLNASLDTVKLDKLFSQSSRSSSCYASRVPKESHPRHTLQFEVLPFPAAMWVTHKVLEVTVLDRSLVESYRLVQERDNPIVQKQMRLREKLLVQSPGSEWSNSRTAFQSPLSDDFLEDSSSIFGSPKSSSGRSDDDGGQSVWQQQQLLQDLSIAGMELASCDISSK